MKYGISGLVTAAVSAMHPRLTPVGRAETNLDGIARQLIRLVVEGHFKPGDRLAPEHELAKQLRVGRSSLREALKALSVVGLLTAHRGRGTFVAERSDYFLRSIALGLWQSDNLDAVLEARRAIEPLIARLAAERADAAAVEFIESCAAKMKESKERAAWDEYLEADMAFHFALADAACNPILNQFLILLRNFLRQIFSTSHPANPAFTSPDDHAQVAAAVRARNPTAAREAMDRLLTNAEHQLRAMARAGLAFSRSGTPVSVTEEPNR